MKFRVYHCVYFCLDILVLGTYKSVNVINRYRKHHTLEIYLLLYCVYFLNQTFLCNVNFNQCQFEGSVGFSIFINNSVSMYVGK